MATAFNYTMADVNISQLETEIGASSITVAIDRIDKSGTDVDIYFKADLSAGEETTLNTLTTDHVAEATPAEANPVLVHEINTETGLAEPVQYSFSEGRNRVLASTKPVIPGKILYFYWTGKADDITGEDLVVGAGESIAITVPSGTDTVEFDMKFGNYSHGELVYLAGGAFQWENTEWGDSITLQVVADPTPTQQVSALDFNVVDDKLVATTPGTGTHGLAGTPFFVPNYTKEGWWNLTEDLQAEFVPGQTGMYDWWVTEKVAASFVNHLPLFGTETKGLQLSSPETSNLPAGYFLRLHLDKDPATNAHEWKVSGSIMMFRERVGNP